MFGRKQAKINGLETALWLAEHKLEEQSRRHAVELTRLSRELDQFAKNSHYDSAAAAKLTADLRQTDQIIYKMGQCSSWNEMQPLFKQLQAFCEARMREESNRMTALLVPAIMETYVNANTQSLEASSVSQPATPRLAGPRDASATHKEGRDNSRDSE